MKCREVKSLVEEAELPCANDIVEQHINRQNLVLCTEYYGRHFHPNLPIIHLPSFDLTRAPLILCSAVFLVGSCYSGGLIPLPHVHKLAMRLLVWIRKQPVSARPHVSLLKFLTFASMR